MGTPLSCTMFNNNKEDEMKKRILAFVLTLAMLLSMMPAMDIHAEAIEGSNITSVSDVSGAEFTRRPDLAEKLDAIFKGNASIYKELSCKNLVNAALGSSALKNHSIYGTEYYYYVGSKGESAHNSGSSCWIYANGVYYTLFGEALGNGTPGKHSEASIKS